MRNTILPFVTVLATALAPRAAVACSIWTPTIERTEASDDDQPPSAIGEVAVEVRRGHCFSGSSCSDIGNVILTFRPSQDDRPDDSDGELQTNIMYDIQRAPAEAPQDGEVLRGLAAFHQPDGSVQLYLTWVDDVGEVQEPLDYELLITPVDLAGNAGPSTTVPVSHPGRTSCDEGGCSAVSATPSSPWAAMLFLPLAAAARRRWARVPPHGG